MARVTLFLILQIVLLTQSFPNPNPEFEIPDAEDPGAPLLLTPYIESGKIEEARDFSRVHFPGLPDLASYAGFFTVDKTYNSNQFLWYFPAKSYVKEQVVFLWLQGGPGVSSLYGLFFENGPLEIINGSIHQRKSHWAKHYHLIYIDNPVGTGFSFTNDSRGYCTNQTQVGEHLYTTLVQFFQLFPELQKYKLFINGESYAGKYIPALGYTIHKKNPTAKVKINLKGLTIGNGWSDPINQLGYSDYLYQVGLLDWNQKEKGERHQNQIIEFIKKEAWLDANNATEQLYGYFGECMGNISIYNYLIPNSNPLFMLYEVLKNVRIKRAIHVGNLTFGSKEIIVREYLLKDTMKSVAPWISELLDQYHILFYNGQLDIIVAYPLTVNFLRKLNFTEREEYLKAERRIINYIDVETKSTQEVGFMKSAGKLTEVLIRNASHMVAHDQPSWISNLFMWWQLNIKD